MAEETNQLMVRNLFSALQCPLGVLPKYLATEALELVGNAARDNKKLKILPHLIRSVVRNDEVLRNANDGV